MRYPDDVPVLEAGSAPWQAIYDWIAAGNCAT